MNRLIEPRGVADKHNAVTQNPVSILLVARGDSRPDEVIKLVSRRPDYRLLACIDPDDDWHSLLPQQSVDILLLQKSVINPSTPFTDERPAEIVISSLQQRFPELRIVVFGHNMDQTFVRRMVHLGVQGLVDSTKSDSSLLTAAIDEVHRGGYWVARKALEGLVQSALEIERIMQEGFVERIAMLQNGLTRREADVLERVLEGMSTKEIAAQLFLSEQGVKLHLGRLFKKFGVANRAQLILTAFQHVCPFNRDMVAYFRQSREQRGVTRH